MHEHSKDRVFYGHILVCLEAIYDLLRCILRHTQFNGQLRPAFWTSNKTSFAASYKVLYL